MRSIAPGCALLLVVLVACTGSGSEEPSARRSTRTFELAPAVTIETAPPPEGDWFDSACALPLEQLLRIDRGYFPGRSPDLMVVPRAPNFFGSFTAQSHSGPWDYLQRVPLVFYGPGFIRGRGEVATSGEVTSADIAPTIAELIDAKSFARGSALTEALLPREQRRERPRLVVTVVWDGGGRDVLDQWRDEWPNLARIIEGGTAFESAVVGSSPSVTPAVHATIGTGAFPADHGVVDIRQRRGDEVVGSWADSSPKYLMVPSLADAYDAEVDNRAKVGVLGDHMWHFGMIGHGSYVEAGDRDIGIITRINGSISTNGNLYRLPSYVEEVPGFEEDVRTIDASDGEVDSRWLGNDIADERLARESPAATLYQTRLIEEVLTREEFGQDDVPDLFFTNYKQIDYAGHRFNMLEPEMRDTVRYSDQELGDLVDLLNETVGERKWVLVLTADHGSTPPAASTGAWPINTDEILDDLEEHFGIPHEEIVEAPRVTGFWLNREGLEANGITPGQVADFMLGMTAEDNLVDRDSLPQGYGERLSEPIFSAAWPSNARKEILACAGGRLD